MALLTDVSKEERVRYFVSYPVGHFVIFCCYSKSTCLVLVVKNNIQSQPEKMCIPHVMPVTDILWQIDIEMHCFCVIYHRQHGTL